VKLRQRWNTEKRRDIERTCKAVAGKAKTAKMPCAGKWGKINGGIMNGVVIEIERAQSSWGAEGGKVNVLERVVVKPETLEQEARAERGEVDDAELVRVEGKDA
jgi:hypothetical protein